MAGPARPGPSRTIGAATISPRRLPASVYAVAMATAIAVVALLVGLSVAPRLQPSDTFQVKPRAVKQQVHDAGAPLVPGSAARTGDGTPLPLGAPWAVVGTAGAPDLAGPANAVTAPPAIGWAGRCVTASGCRGPPA